MDFKRVIVLLLLAAFGCRQQDSIISPNYTMLPPQDSARLALAEKWKAVKTPAPAITQSIDQGWRYVAGINESLTDFEFPEWEQTEVLDLPHRVTLPNTAMWYQRLVVDPIDSSVLEVNADDGAQVFLNSKKLERLIDDRFYLTATAGDTLTIRVLNNAMAGGLRTVKLISLANYRDYKSQLALYRKAGAAVDQVLRLSEPPADAMEAAGLLVEHPTIENITKVEALFSAYPMLSAPVLLNNKGRFELNWLSTGSGQAVIFAGNDPTHLTTEFIVTAKQQPFRFPLEQLSKASFYRIRQLDTWTEVYEVPKMELNADSFSFTLWADSQGGWNTFSKLMSNTNEYDDKFSLGVGDLVANGSDSLQWKSLLTSLGQAKGRFPFYLVPGNHDYDGYYDDLRPKNFNQYITTASGKNYFSWQYGNCAFVAIDPNEAFPIGFGTSDQKQWFLREIESPEWKAATWHFVVLHQPPLSQGWPGYHGDEVVRQLLDTVYESAGIDFVVAGHTHDYERLTRNYGDQKVNFLIVGGAGGGLEPEGEMSEEPVMDVVVKRHHLARMFVQGDSIHLEVKDLNQNIIDQFDFKKQ
ncbi:metallophosphoesterase [uncultured Imperialibacter sp.]|uniref:metallophosphoesterase family protein n=1 Tax=uncultured Imperialibacter sp. TaxID=1672639 RepID=UPI0030DD3207|tara:strand:- start:10311 stop:12056 length:1746 start_codon:yes stop_codon:yes gene_type:complete